MNPVEQPLVVITGAAGLIGTLVARDLAGDHRVVGLDIAAPKTRIEGMDLSIAISPAMKMCSRCCGR